MPRNESIVPAIALAVAVLALSGCQGLGRKLPPGYLSFELTRALIIPARFAHTKFQGGRQVSGVNRYEPWCELEIQTVSEEPQRVEPARLEVYRLGEAFIKDYNTRAPALSGGLSCDDLVFQETIWWVKRNPDSPVLYLRCLAPYTNCRFGSALSPEDTQLVIGPKIDIQLGAGS